MNYKDIFIVASLALLCGCANKQPFHETTETAVAFADDYFNFRYEQALEKCTEESGQWLRFAASNITSDDISVLNSRPKPASCSVKETTMRSDTAATVLLSVHNCIVKDSLGTPLRSITAGTTTLDVVRRDGSWRVKLSALPRIKRQK